MYTTSKFLQKSKLTFGISLLENKNSNDTFFFLFQNRILRNSSVVTMNRIWAVSSRAMVSCSWYPDVTGCHGSTSPEEKGVELSTHCGAALRLQGTRKASLQGCQLPK